MLSEIVPKKKIKMIDNEKANLTKFSVAFFIEENKEFGGVSVSFFN